MPSRSLNEAETGLEVKERGEKGKSRAIKRMGIGGGHRESMRVDVEEHHTAEDDISRPTTF